MEPAAIMPLMSSSPPALDAVGRGEVGAEEEELRGFRQFPVGVSCRPPGLADCPQLTSSLGQPSPPIKSATHHSGSNLNLPVKQSQPTFSMNLGSGWNEKDMEHQALKAESGVPLTNDYRRADTCIAFAANACIQKEEVGFADFTVFTEQSVHHWCCGFTPSGNPEKFNSRLGQGNSSNSPLGRTYSPGQGGLVESELLPHCSYKEKEEGCTIIRSWQEGDAAVARPYQDQQQPQETSATLFFEKRESDQSDLICRGSGFKTSEVWADGCEQSNKQEEPGNYHSGNNSTVKCAESKTEEDLHHFNSSATQEDSATSSLPQSGMCNDISDTDCGLESHRDPVHVRGADAAVLILGTLPPSDSFADFCAAPVQGDGEDLWAEFTDMKEQDGGPAWTGEQVNYVPTEDEDKAEQCGVAGQTDCQVSLSSRVQQLFPANFLEAEGPSPALVQEVLSLTALLDVQHLPQREDKQQHSQWIQRGLSWLHDDLHSAVGLRFQWGGSHSSRTLLRCLGVDAKNNRLLETKDTVSAVCSPRHTSAPPALQDTPAPSTATIQETIPSNQMHWNNRSLKSSQDGTSLRRAPHFWGRK